MQGQRPPGNPAMRIASTHSLGTTENNQCHRRFSPIALTEQKVEVRVVLSMCRLKLTPAITFRSLMERFTSLLILGNYKLQKSIAQSSRHPGHAELTDTLLTA